MHPPPSTPRDADVRACVQHLTYGSGLVSLFVGAHTSAVEQGVQGLLLPAARQAAQALGARPRVHAARLPLREGARQAAAAAGLLDQLAAHGHRGAHGHRLVVAGLARHVGRQAAGQGQPQDEGRQKAKAEKHGCVGGRL